MDYSARQRKLRSTLGRHKFDALLVTHLPNVCYLSGFRGSAGALLLTENSSVFFTDGRYNEQARAEVQGARVIVAAKPPLFSAAEWLASHTKGKCRLGVDAAHLTWDAYRRLRTIAGASVRILPAPPLVEEARLIKDAGEIALIRAAADLGAALFKTVLKTLRPGVKETAVAGAIEYAARKSGGQGMSFPTIVVSGARSALPHGQPADVAIRSSGFVVCDFGVILTGYCSDRTRTVYVGRPTREARRIYQAVREAQQTALAVVAPGRTVGEVDRAARNVLRKNGLGKYFTHSTGHGVGLEIHEAPRISAGQTDLLQPGMVITVEPGIYIPGQWGVRIEDMVLVTEAGFEVLAPSSTELIAL